jgi:hypothetical protein
MNINDVRKMASARHYAWSRTAIMPYVWNVSVFYCPNIVPKYQEFVICYLFLISKQGIVVRLSLGGDPPVLVDSN